VSLTETSVVPHIPPRQSLSARLWLLTTIVVLLSEMAVFLPEVGHEWRNWLFGRVEDAAIATLALDAAPGSHIDENIQSRALRLAVAAAIKVTAPDGTTVTIGDTSVVPTESIDLRQVSLSQAITSGIAAIIWQGDKLVELRAENPFEPGGTVWLVFHRSLLSKTLARFATDFAALALLIAGVTGALVYLAVLLLLVQPIRRLTGSIAAFRADPEQTTPIDPKTVTRLPNDEMAMAGRELAAMQHELRAALWRNARLVALGTVFAKVSHDLRGILTPALLSAERLQLNPDPKVQRAGETLAQAVDRATELVRRSLDYAREGPPALEFLVQGLAPLIDEATTEVARQAHSALKVENALDPLLQVKADRTQLFRVLVNLLRNAAEAGARKVRVTVTDAIGVLAIDITDDGPGLPEAVQAALFRPFAGSVRHGGTGLGLAIARDLMVAHGGDISLVATGGEGTTFRLTLPLVVVQAPVTSVRVEAEAPVVAAARIAPATEADV
jgi:signal transduction histidine kinase